MKKILFFAIVVFGLFASCTKSPEQKAEALIKEYLEKTLYHPDTYAPTETKLDSAFTPFDSPDFYEKTLKMAKLSMAVQKYDDEVKQAQSEVSLWSGPYQTSYERNSLQEAKEKYEIALENKNKAIEESKKLGEILKKDINKKGEFIGFKAFHSYRANNNAGQTIGGRAEFIFDKNMTKIIASYDLDSEESQAVAYIYKMMRGETSMADGISIDD